MAHFFAVAFNAHLVAADHRAAVHQRAGNKPRAQLHHFLDGGRSHDGFHHVGFQEPFHGGFDIFQKFKDNRVAADFNAFAFGFALGFVLHVHMEADDDGVAGFGEQNVGLVDVARRGEDNIQLHFVGRNAKQRVFNGFNGALHVGL